MSKYEFFNRDISWLSFNYRVLEEAMDRSLPIYERIKFLAIYSNNMEEFYSVRVSYYKQMLRQETRFPEQIKRVQPAKVIHEINEIVSEQQVIFHKVFEDEIIPELRKNNIHIVDSKAELSEDEQKYLRELFFIEVLTQIQPVLLLKYRIRPFLQTGNVYLALEMVIRDRFDKKTGKRREQYAIIKVPLDRNLPRFIELPSDGKVFKVMFLEDLIMRHVDAIFPGFIVKNYYSIKLTRDADLEYDDYEGEDLIDVIEDLRKHRSLGKPNRFQYDRTMPKKLLNYLVKSFYLYDDTLVKGGSRHNFRDFFTFPNPRSPELEIDKWPPLTIPVIEGHEGTMASLIEERDLLLSVPYQRYDYLIDFLSEASRDSSVEEIKTTQYRVAENSTVIKALINAAENGKRVTVFVELKARFDEEANLEWAAEMKKAGIRILYSIPKLKVHAKIALVIRGEESEIGDQVYLGTGNFNEKTAKLYGDHGLFTSHIGIVNEVKDLYRHLEDQNHTCSFDHILVPGFNMVDQFTTLIRREVENVKAGKDGYILLKMNGLQDISLVEELYRASEEGVQIDLIIRGICILKPEQPYSKNIRVIRIVDRFLEHARVFVFHNDGNPKVFMGSADWMKRNLTRRIECVFPIYEKELKEELMDVLNIQLSDNVKASLIDENLQNVRVRNEQPSLRSQRATYEYFREKYS
ncbi:MAG: polyphosphate kinase 1 [Bacteroidales bacterium]|nr:polyphosphate kinase 1 [Bacteroidales bacterium]MDT8431429.1 polyphosphate kinase 1 [Bacteroidales bacterium]